MSLPSVWKTGYENSPLEDVKIILLERGARRALVGIFGEGWYDSEFVSPPQKIRDNAFVGLGNELLYKIPFLSYSPQTLPSQSWPIKSNPG